MKAYPFHRYRIDPVPCAPLPRALNESRLALVTTAGLHTSDEPPFDGSIRAGDASYREIPNTIATASLLESHKSGSFDHAGIEADRNVAFPLDRCRELVSSGRIGELNRRHFSFMGSVIGPRKLIEETSVQVARLLRQDRVDAVLLTPV